MIQRYILKKEKAHDIPKEITWHFTHSCDNISIVTHDYIPSKLELLYYTEKGAEAEKKGWREGGIKHLKANKNTISINTPAIWFCQTCQSVILRWETGSNSICVC